jgi:hypothetical protein
MASVTLFLVESHRMKLRRGVVSSSSVLSVSHRAACDRRNGLKADPSARNAGLGMTTEDILAAPAGARTVGHDTSAGIVLEADVG